MKVSTSNDGTPLCAGHVKVALLEYDEVSFETKAIPTIDTKGMDPLAAIKLAEGLHRHLLVCVSSSGSYDRDLVSPTLT